jgi:tetratricopeptide (TPR) repeat protein
MRVKPNADEAILLERSQTNSPAAYEAYLRGRAILRAPEEYPASAAIEPLLDATHADSLFGDAHAALGWAYVLAYETEQDAPPSYVLQASSSVQRAIVLGAKGSETFRVWGTIEQFRGNIAKARERFDQAVAMSPSDAESQRRLARICLIQGQYDLALKAAKRSAIDDPANVEALSMLGKVQQFIGEYVHAGENEAKESRASLMDAAHSYEMAMRMAHDRSEFGAGLYADVLVYIQQPDRSIEIYNDRIARDRDSYIDFYKLGRVDQTAGRPKQEWEEAFLRAKSILGVRLQEEPEDAVAFSVLALVETRLGGFKEALAASRRALELAPTDLDVLFNTARMYALQRDKGTALQYLQRALTRKYSIAHLLDMDFYNLRAEPEFIRAISG